MAKLLSAAAATLILGCAPALATNYRDYHPCATTPASTNVHYAGPVSLHEYYAQHGYAGPLLGYAPQQSVTPQFNNLGPQISVPQRGNPMDQLSPLMGTGQPDALGTMALAETSRTRSPLCHVGVPQTFVLTARGLQRTQFEPHGRKPQSSMSSSD